MKQRQRCVLDEVRHGGGSRGSLFSQKLSEAVSSRGPGGSGGKKRQEKTGRCDPRAIQNSTKAIEKDVRMDRRTDGPTQALSDLKNLETSCKHIVLQVVIFSGSPGGGLYSFWTRMKVKVVMRD